MARPEKPAKNATNLFEAGAPSASLHSYVHANEIIEYALSDVHLLGARFLIRPFVPPEGQDQRDDVDQRLQHGHPAAVGLPSSPGTGARAVTPSGAPNSGVRRASVGRRSRGEIGGSEHANGSMSVWNLSVGAPLSCRQHSGMLLGCYNP